MVLGLGLSKDTASYYCVQYKCPSFYTHPQQKNSVLFYFPNSFSFLSRVAQLVDGLTCWKYLFKSFTSQKESQTSCVFYLKINIWTASAFSNCHVCCRAHLVSLQFVCFYCNIVISYSGRMAFVINLDAGYSYFFPIKKKSHASH